MQLIRIGTDKDINEIFASFAVYVQLIPDSSAFTSDCKFTLKTETLSLLQTSV